MITRIVVPGATSFVSETWVENTDGQGDFGPPQTIAPESGVVADLDGDGDWDMFYSGCADYPFICDSGWSENIDGAGQFRQHDVPMEDAHRLLYDVEGDGVKRVPATPPIADGFNTIDFDGDGDLDRINTDQGNLVKWVENTDGMATFEARPVLPYEGARSLPADLDLDGDSDILVQNGEEFVWVSNDGNGSFSDARTTEIRLAGTMMLGELTGNGPVEIVDLDPATGEGSWYEYMPQDDAFVKHAFTAPRREVAQQAVDMDNDGDLDLVGLQAWYEQQDSLAEWARHGFAQIVRPVATVALDVESDGDQDIAVVSMLGRHPSEGFRLAWRQAVDDEQSVEHILIPESSQRIEKLYPFDMDDDGDDDLVVTNSYGNLNWFENTDSDTPLQDRGQLVRRQGTILDLGDIDDDGDLDFLASHSASNVLNWKENRGDTFVTHEVSDSNSRDVGMAALADIDGDGDLDLISSRDEIIVWHENLDGNGQFGNKREIGRGVGRQRGNLEVSGIQTVDINGDGDLDVVVTSVIEETGGWLPPPQTYQSQIYDNQDGLGRFARAGDVNDRKFVLASDLDGDGLGDLVEEPQQLAGIVVHENTTQRQSTADLNRDGVTNATDVDRLCRAIAEHDEDSVFDVNDDGRIDLNDHRHLVENQLDLIYGDANEDGDFDSSDLIRVFQRGEYEDRSTANSSWNDGDWNCDREFTSSDLVLAMTFSHYQAMSRDAMTLVASRNSDQILRYDSDDGRFVAEFAAVERPLSLATGPDGDIYVTHGASKLILSRFRADGQLVTSIAPRGGPSQIQFGPDGTLYGLDFGGRRIHRFSVADDRIVELEHVTAPRQPDAFAVGPDNNLFIGTRFDEQIWRYDGVTGEQLDLVADWEEGDDTPRPQSPLGTTYGPDGHLYVGIDVGGSGEVRRFDIETGEMIDVFIEDVPHKYGDLIPTFTADGRYILIAIANDDGRVFRYDATSGQLVDVLVGAGSGGLDEASSVLAVPGSG